MNPCNDKQTGPVPTMEAGIDTQPLREAVLAQTTRVIRRRRWVRRGAIGTALVLCYVAGLGTMRVWTGVSPPTGPAPIAAAEESGPITPKVAAEPVAPKAVGKQIASNRTRPRKSRFEIICEIGDRYLYRDADTEAAIRGYRRALRVATPEELKICPQRDSWLLMALKQELKGKERRDENRGA